MANAALSSTTPSRGFSEDWLAVGIGLFIFVCALVGLQGIDVLGWVVTTSVWTDATKALGTASKSYAGLGGLGALIATLANRVQLTSDGHKAYLEAVEDCRS